MTDSMSEHARLWNEYFQVVVTDREGDELLDGQEWIDKNLIGELADQAEQTGGSIHVLTSHELLGFTLSYSVDIKARLEELVRRFRLFEMPVIIDCDGGVTCLVRIQPGLSIRTGEVEPGLIIHPQGTLIELPPSSCPDYWYWLHPDELSYASAAFLAFLRPEQTAVVRCLK
ncbi:MAG: hypothetical protein AAFX02_08810 [Pseudomonadota bacterium]